MYTHQNSFTCNIHMYSTLSGCVNCFNMQWCIVHCIPCRDRFIHSILTRHSVLLCHSQIYWRINQIEPTLETRLEMQSALSSCCTRWQNMGVRSLIEIPLLNIFLTNHEFFTSFSTIYPVSEIYLDHACIRVTSLYITHTYMSGGLRYPNIYAVCP